MPLLSTFGAAPAKAFGFTSGGKEQPGSWFAPEGQNAAASYQPAGYATVTVTVAGVSGGTGNYNNNYFRWFNNNGAINAYSGTKRGNASSVTVSGVDPTNLSFRTVETSSTDNLGWTSGSDGANYSGSKAKQANQAVFTGQPGGGASVAFHPNNLAVYAAGAGGAAVGRPDRNVSYPGTYNARTDADESNNNVSNNLNNGSNNGNAPCYYSSGGSGGGDKGGLTAPNSSSTGGYSGNSYVGNGSLTTGLYDTDVGDNQNIGYSKIEWS
mgnify:CR=1 FL=1|jgi:hypothetical protein|tara:strand:- start:4482 stop:5285 length:804 start_codon:yes stop_codon:yes gene_type:complete